MPKKEEILTVLEELNSFDDVLACMLVRKGFEGISPTNIKIKNAALWTAIRKTTNELFVFIEKFFEFQLQRVTFELGEYIIIIAPVSKNISLLVVIPSFANQGLIDIEIENAKRKLLKSKEYND